MAGGHEADLDLAIGEDVHVAAVDLLGLATELTAGGVTSFQVLPASSSRPP